MSRNPTTDGARRTRDRILDAALELFNDRGSAAVTTNHVAARAGISPGNLYYWFSDKNEIVRELYGRLAAADAAMWDAGGGSPANLTPDELLGRLSAEVVLSRRYAFLARELLGLLHSDPVLASAYGAVRARRTAAFRALAHLWREQGVIRCLDDREIADLVQALWIIAEMWLTVGELDGTYVDAADGNRLLRVVLQPYLLHEAKADEVTVVRAACQV